MKKTVQRIYRFSLSAKDANHEEVKGIIENLIGQGALSRVIRDGIRLINDLSAGRVDVLLEMYPWITDAICPKTPDNDDMERRIADAVAQKLKGELHQSRTYNDLPDTRDYGIPAMKQSGAGIGTGNIAGASVPMALPNFDDDDDDMGETMLIKKTEPPKMNLLEGLFAVMDNGLQGKNHTADANAKALKGLRQH